MHSFIIPYRCISDLTDTEIVLVRILEWQNRVVCYILWFQAQTQIPACQVLHIHLWNLLWLHVWLSNKKNFVWSWQHWYSLKFTDLGSLIEIFDYGYSIVWKFKFSHFPGTLILCEINFWWFQKVKNCHYNTFGGFEFWFCKIFTLETTKISQKFKLQSC